MGSRSGYLAGGFLLVAAWLAVFAWAMSIGASCDTDCGDNGGRGAFIGLVLATPLGGAGLALVVLGVRRPGSLLKLATRASIMGAALLAILALVVGIHGADQVLDSLTGSDLHAIGQESHERSKMLQEGIASAVVAVILLGLAATGLLPWLAARRRP